jgi:L-asparaginase
MNLHDNSWRLDALHGIAQQAMAFYLTQLSDNPHRCMMFIRFVTTGGTIDKIYFDAMSQFEVGDSQIRHILAEGLATFDYDVVPLFQKDSLDITDEDRATLRRFLESDDASLYVITHGTDTMTETAAVLQGLHRKSIVLTGALSPARFRTTDAVFNIGMAVAAVQLVQPGVYIAMNGRVFAGDAVSKNRSENRFEAIG